jgi:flavin-binding protein dodecin
MGHGGVLLRELAADWHAAEVVAILPKRRDRGRETSSSVVNTNLARRRGKGMHEHVYKKIEIVGTSAESYEAATKNALARAAKTIHNMRWFEVTEFRGAIKDGAVHEFQVTLKIGFTLEE